MRLNEEKATRRCYQICSQTDIYYLLSLDIIELLDAYNSRKTITAGHTKTQTAQPLTSYKVSCLPLAVVSQRTMANVHFLTNCYSQMCDCAHAHKVFLPTAFILHICIGRGTDSTDLFLYMYYSAFEYLLLTVMCRYIDQFIHTL